LGFEGSGSGTGYPESIGLSEVHRQAFIALPEYHGVVALKQ
jgi:hypothetical protein